MFSSLYFLYIVSDSLVHARCVPAFTLSQQTQLNAFIVKQLRKYELAELSSGSPFLLTIGLYNKISTYCNYVSVKRLSVLPCGKPVTLP